MHTTFTIQSVHGLKDTFVVNPNGMVNTAQPQPQIDSAPPQNERSQGSNQHIDEPQKADKPR